MSDSEQWLLDGNCNKCRKNKYCSKPCRAYKNSQRIAIQRAFSKIMVKALSRKDGMSDE